MSYVYTGLSRPEASRNRRDYDDMSYSTFSSTSQLVQIASYDVDGPVLRLFSSSSEAADTKDTKDTKDTAYTAETSVSKQRVAVTVYDGSESDSSGSGSGSESSAQSSRHSSYSDIARKGSESIQNQPAKKQVKAFISSPPIPAQSSSFFVNMFSCLHPSTQDEIDTKYVKTQASVSASASPSPSSNSKQDVLDTVFGAMEHLVCNETSSLDPQCHMIPSKQERNPDILDKVFEGLERGMCTSDRPIRRGRSSSSKIQSEQRMRDMANRKVRELTQYENDMLDNLFESMENVACSEKLPSNRYDSDLPHRRDVLDRLFESIEDVTCRDDRDSLGVRDKASLISRGKDPPGKIKQNQRIVTKRDDDTFDYICSNFETVLGLSSNATYTRRPDIVDDAFGSVKHVVCKQDVQSGGSVSPIDLTSLSRCSEEQNSIADPIRDYEEIARREALRKIRDRGPSGSQKVMGIDFEEKVSRKVHPTDKLRLDPGERKHKRSGKQGRVFPEKREQRKPHSRLAGE